MKHTGYQLVGFMVTFDIVPDFLFPVYEKNNKYYFHNGNQNRILNFVHAENDIENRIIFINDPTKDIKTSNPKLLNKKYFKHDVPVYAIQCDEKEIYYDYLFEMIKFISTIKTKDTLFKKQIINFIEENSMYAYLFLISQKRISELNHLIKGYYSTNITYGFTPKDHIHTNISKLITNKHHTIIYKKNDSALSKIVQIANAALKITDILSFSSYAPSKIIEFIIKEYYHYEFYNNYYCFCRNNNMNVFEADFKKLLLSFDKIIKGLECKDEFYKICIKCQNAVINEDENDLLSILNMHVELFMSKNFKTIADSYLFRYVSTHINNSTIVKGQPSD